jgi:hypothetical protein
MQTKVPFAFPIALMLGYRVALDDWRAGKTSIPL